MPALAVDDSAELEPPRIQRGFERLLAWSRLLVLIPVVFLLLDAAGSFVYGTDLLLRSASGVIAEPAQVGGRLGIFLIVMDTFLVGATLMIGAFGFYELFVIRSERASHRTWLPAWLKMHDLEDLKARVVSMLILVAAITFVDRTVEAHGTQDVLFLGVGISIIIVALTAFLWFGRRNPRAGDSGPVPSVDAGPGSGSGSPGSGSPGSGSGAASRGIANGSAPAGGSARDGSTGDRTSGGGSARNGSAGGGNSGGSTSGTSDPGGDVHDDSAGGGWAAPALRPGVPTAAGAAGEGTGARSRVTAILGITRREGNWTAAEQTDVIATAGSARLDLRDAVLPGQRLTIRAVAGLGLVSVIVPAWMDVAESGMTILGVRSASGTAPAPSRPGAPTLVLSGSCVLGMIRVRRMP